MPAVGLIGAPLLIKALTVWLEIYSRIKPKKFKDSEEKDESHLYEKVNGAKKTKEADPELRLRFSRIGSVLLGSHIFGWLFVKSGVWLSKVGFDLLGFAAKNSIYVGYFLYFNLSVNIPHVISLTRAECDILNIVALLELTTLLLTIAMHNFSLALVLSVIYVPCITFITVKAGW